MSRCALRLFVAACLCLAGGAALAIATNATSAPTSHVRANTATDPPPDAAIGDLDEVMRLLAKRQHGRVEFIEQQFLSVLDHPVESSGELRYDAPDRLEKRTLLPRPENLMLSGGVLTMERGGHQHVLDLHRYPQIQPFVESIRATLAGDRSALERIFHVVFAGSVERWSLTLVPLDHQLARSVKQVQIDGSRDRLSRVEIRQADGDRSLMTLRTPAAP
jgi:Outer membrane lipoprotein carrier protein LolA-like